jgi:hypothetical protein
MILHDLVRGKAGSFVPNGGQKEAGNVARYKWESVR